MTQPRNDKLDFAAMLPGVGVFGGIRRFIEIGNELVRRGHTYTLYHPKGDAPKWLPFDGEVRPSADLSKAHHQILLCNDPPSLDLFAKAQADLKCFYFVGEKMPNEGSISRSPDWTILANSTGVRDRLRRKYGVLAETVIGGINLDVFNPQEHGDSDHYRVLTFGRLSRRTKGVPIVLSAVESFARSVARKKGARPVKLVLFDHIGQHNERDPRKEIQCSIPYEFHVNLGQEELAELYSSCDVFVSAERRAGWANTTVEAMACGVPVVCTRAGTRDIAAHRETAWVVRWRHRYFVGRGVHALHADPDLAHRLRNNALERVRSFSWSHVVDQLEAVVRRRLSGPSVTP
jgi:glycosyltransferase involved in cell wall biosynthesis